MGRKISLPLDSDFANKLTEFFIEQRCNNIFAKEMAVKVIALLESGKNEAVCKNCKYWAAYTISNNRFGECKNKIFVNVPIAASEHLLGDRVALFNDISRTSVSFGEDFGCVHWERKENDERKEDVHK